MPKARGAQAGPAPAVLVLFALAGCGGGGALATGTLNSTTSAPSVPNGPLGTNAIKHVVVIVQENRSFDNFFHSFPGADTVSSGMSSTGQVALEPVDLTSPDDIEHLHETFEQEYDGGKLDGFDHAGVITPPHQSAQRGQLFPYGYVPASQIAPYWALAREYVLADRTFESNSGPSFPAHQYLIAGQDDDVPDGPNQQPWGCDSPPGTQEAQINSSGGLVPGPFPCFSYDTLAKELDARGIDWRFYAPAVHAPGGVFSAYDAIRYVRYGADWTSKVISPETRVLDDVANGDLAPVTWVVPSALNSDHSGTGSATGPQWVASVVDAVGESRFWNSTAIFILWDDWGGWYDHVVPPQYDVMGPGFRIPLIVVSPFAKQGYVSHVQHEAVSTAKFIEDAFGLPSLGTADARADDLVDCFDFSHAGRRFHRLAIRMRPQDFLGRPDDPPDTE